jgi:hypothetical protein
MNNDKVYEILEFIENVKEKLTTMEYIDIMNILKKNHKHDEIKLYTVEYSINQGIDIQDELKVTIVTTIRIESLVRMNKEDFKTIKDISTKKVIHESDLEDMFRIMYVLNNINLFNVYEINTSFINNKRRIFYTFDPRIISIKEAKDLEKDSYEFVVSYSYKKENDIKNIVDIEKSDIEMYSDYDLSVIIKTDISRGDYFFIKENIRDLGLKLLFEKQTSMEYKIKKRGGEVTSEIFIDEVFIEELFETIQFTYIEFKPFIEYNGEKYFVYITGLTVF